MLREIVTKSLLHIKHIQEIHLNNQENISPRLSGQEVKS